MKSLVALAENWRGALAALGALLISSCTSAVEPRETPAASGSAPGVAQLDRALADAAAGALGEREGTILVIDPRDGRLRAAVNPRLASAQAFPPGSAVKPFTALAALRAGAINAESRTHCRRFYSHGDFSIACTHPPVRDPLNLVQALGYSCNYYFATLAERLNGSAWRATLGAFGFGRRTGLNTGNEATGELLEGGEWHARTALGEGEGLLATPIQVLTAYAALVNGGHLWRPRLVPAENFTPEERNSVKIPPSYRNLLHKGMRGAVEYGTGARAGLNSLPLAVFGKTGTSTDSNGFRTQGWFVGFAGGTSQGPALGVLVFLRRSQGAECAEIARPIFEAYARFAGEDDPKAASLPAGPGEGPEVRVRLIGAGETLVLPLGEYLRGVMLAEAGIEDESEALKAQVVASRTYALRNLGRHQDEGYDFCSTTHCQRYRRAAANKGAGAKAARIVADTSGMVLRDDRGDLIEAYFHAACGGETANIKMLWNTPASLSYLSGVRDDYCATMPHRHWQELIPAADLLRAMRSDPRSDVGDRLNRVSVRRRDETGRAAIVLVEGEKRRELSGWDFKIIVGRALGWNLLKSSRFEVAPSGKNFIFRGSGFGHGLGLCQEGAHVMARRGADYEKILQFYYPGTRLDRRPSSSSEFRPDPLWQSGRQIQNVCRGRARPCPWLRQAEPGQGRALPLLFSQGGPLSLGGENFQVTSRGGTKREEIERVLEVLEGARRAARRRLDEAALNRIEPPRMKVIIHATTAEFIEATGLPGWTAAATRGDFIHTQPLGLLRRRAVLETTLRHEYAHALIEKVGRGRTPRWLAEGFAAHLAGEGPLLARHPARREPGRDELERRLAHPTSLDEARELYAAAWREVRALLRKEGEPALWRKIAQEGRAGFSP